MPTTADAPQQQTHPSSADSDLDNRPILLCLHGGGSTPVVFKIQLRRLIWQLSSQFRFVFPQGPIECDAGFGMLPTFASCAPFYRWVSRKWRLGEGRTEGTPEGEVRAIEEAVAAAVGKSGSSREGEGGEGDGDVPWEKVVGAIGFSQGARLVPGLLLKQLKAKRDGKTCRWDLKFGVMVGGPFPPICLEPMGEIAVEDYELLRTIPTVHAWGRDDHVKSGCEEMAAACEGDTCFQMDFEGGHHMPLKDVEAKDLCDLIMAAWYAGGGKMEVGRGEKY